MTNIILCGGSGTRLWPISRTLMPKQFVKLFDDKSLFQLTVERNSEICDKNFIVSNAEQYFLSQDQLEELSPTNHQPSTIDHKPSPMDHEPQTINYLLEPVGRNTAPAIALACLNLDPEEIVLVSPSDHLIKNVDEYKKVLDKAQELASSGYLVTFGIKASSPEVGYGYIEASLVDGGLSMDVVSFHEKPDFDTALKYLEAGNYFWNSGIFCFKAGVFLSELEKYSKEIYTKSVIANNNAKKTDMTRIHMDDMLGIPEDSIDYAVMEKSSIVKVIGADIDWSDLGSFDALYDELPKDKDGNTKNANHISIDSKNNLIYGSERKIATVDMEDTIIVDTGDALLVSKKGSSQKVKKVVEKLKEGNSELQNIHLTGHRPWGTYTVLEDSLGYKIKRIEVKPGKRLSLQKHYHRNEHWIVVSGTATVTVGDTIQTVRPNESTYIKMGEVHRLENEGKIPVVLIEAQVGEYTGEDDIVRIEDDFCRF